MRKTLKEIRCEEDYEKDFVKSRCEKDNNITLYFKSTDVSDNEYILYKVLGLCISDAYVFFPVLTILYQITCECSRGIEGL